MQMMHISVLSVVNNIFFLLSAEHFLLILVTYWINHFLSVVCSKNDKRFGSRYECKDCNVGLRIDPYFEIYYTELHY